MRRLLLFLQLIMAMTASAVNMYVIGENVNGKSWVLSDESSKMSEIIPGVYQWRGQVLGSGFKFNNGDWIDPDLNIGSDGSRLMLGSEYRYITGPTSGNICYAFDSEVINPVVTLNLNDKTVLVEGQTTGNSQNIVFISWDNAIYGSPDIILTSNNITLKASQGLASNPPVINSTSKDLRIYARGQLSLSSQLLMTKVVFPLSAQGLRRLSEMEVSEGKLTYDLNNKVVIWSGQSHNFTIRVGEKATLGTDGANSAAQFDILSPITITCSDTPNPDFGYPGDLYLIGSNVNGQNWVLAQEDAKFDYIGDGKYEWHGDILGSGFKINDGTWDNPIYNIGSNDSPINIGEEYFYFQDSGNIRMPNDEDVYNPHVIIDIKNQYIYLEGEPRIPEERYLVCGTFNGWNISSSDAVMEKEDNLYILHHLVIPELAEGETGYFKITKPYWVDNWGFGAYTDVNCITPETLSAHLTREYYGNQDMPITISGIYDVIWDPRTEIVSFKQVINNGILTVNLPKDAADGRYKNCFIELIDNETGSAHRFVVTDRLTYTFNGLNSGSTYTVRLLSPAQVEIARIADYVMSGENASVTFSNIRNLHTVTSKVTTTDGKNVTDQVTVEWYTPIEDGSLSYLKKGQSIADIADGQVLICKVSLDSDLGTLYKTPAEKKITVGANSTTCEFVLAPFREIALSGIVTDEDGSSINGASVVASQILNSKFSKTFTTKTDRQGAWTLKVFDAPEAQLTYSATDYINVNDTIDLSKQDITQLELGKVKMKSITGARVNYNFTFKEAGADNISSYYSDYQNVAIDVFNVTQNRNHDHISLQYPLLVISDSNVNGGDQIRLTASSKTGVFNPVEKLINLDDQRHGDVTFDLIGKGGITSSFEMTENPQVVALLYTDKGELVKKQAYSEAKVSFNNLEDGDYILVTMGQSDLMNSILRLSSFSEIGLKQGTDYMLDKVTVESGKISDVKIFEIPTFDESIFYYTNNSAGYSSNKSQITAGNYLTLRAAIDFKEAYKKDIKNVSLVVDFPDACDFVDHSVIQGPNTLPYTLNGNRLTVALGNNYQTQVRFCVVPTAGGTFRSSASIVFDYKGQTVTQPIGSSSTDTKDIEINIPFTISNKTFRASGVATANSNIKVYDDQTLIGNGVANSTGFWSAECELVNPYNLSAHAIHAVIETPGNNDFVTETRTLTYDTNAIEVSKVTMYHWNPEMRKTYEAVFDFLNPKVTPTKWIVYYPDKKFTYTIEFTENDPERVSNVILYVHTADGKIVPVNANYDDKKGFWVAEIDMGNTPDSYYPVNCSIDFDYESNVIMSAEEFQEIANSIAVSQSNFSDGLPEIQILQDKLASIRDLNQPDSTEELDIYNEIFKLLGINVEFSYEEALEYSDEEIHALQSSYALFCEEYNEINLNDFLNVQISDINNIVSNEASSGKIAVTELDDLSDDIINNYAILPLSNGSNVYILSENNKITIVDPTNRLKYEFIQDTENSGRSMLQTKSSSVEQIRDFISQIDQKTATAREVISKIFDILDEVDKHLEKGMKWCSENCNDAFTRLQRLKRAEASGKKINQLQKASLEFLVDNANNSYLGLKKIRETLSNFNSSFYSKALGGLGLIATFIECRNELNKLVAYYYSVPNPCKDDESEANSIRSSIVQAGVSAGLYYVGNITADVLSLLSIGPAVSAAPVTSGSSLGVALLAVGKIALSYGINALYTNTINKFYNKTQIRIGKLNCIKNCGQPGMPKCEKDPDNKPNGGDHQSGEPNNNIQIDPSGYVYEAVPENRLEGVQASIYYKETKEDMYGDPYDEIVLWNAEEYAQKNPLFTDENGFYQWDVPQGLWQVKFEKDGYNTVFSEWLPVPPPQLDVNIAMVQNKQPDVIMARAFEDGVEVRFDKYMKPETLTPDNIFITANGEKIRGEIVLLNSALADEFESEENADATRFASRVRFVPETSLGITAKEVLLTVKRDVISYAGLNMAETFTQMLDVEKEVQAIVAENTKVLYGGEKEVTVYALPYEAAAGRKLHITTSSDMIASVDQTEVTLDEDGRAVLSVKGELPGRAQLSFTIDDVLTTGECEVDVVNEIIVAETPKASRASGTAVYRGSKIELTTDSKDGVIYFTTDGSCPCDANGTRRKYTVPVVIDEDTKILAVTVVGDGDEDMSDIAEFNYSIKKNVMDISLAKGWNWISHSFETPVEASKIMNAENVKQIVGPKSATGGALITELVPAENYKVYASADTHTGSLEGIAWSPATAIPVETGWNRLGYPLPQSLPVNEAFDINAVEKHDMIIGQNGFSQYDGEKWTGTLETLSPGEGYMFVSGSPKNLKYTRTLLYRAPMRLRMAKDADNLFTVDVHKYPSVMPVIAGLTDKEGNAIDSGLFNLYAFSGDECRGIGSVVDGMIMMSVYGDENDPITFRIDDENFSTVFPQEDFTNSEITFGDKVLGSISSPYLFTMKGDLNEINEIKESGSIRVKAVGNMLVIEGIDPGEVESVEIYDTAGMKLLEEKKITSAGTLQTNLVNGIYVVIIKAKEEIHNRKISLR